MSELYDAIIEGDLEAMRRLLDRGADVNQARDNGDTPLLIASMCGHKEVCALLLDRGANVDQAAHDGCTPLFLASQNGHKEVCALLLDRGANVNQARDNGKTPLYVASEHGHEEICKLLLDRGANVNHAINSDPPRLFEETPLIIATERNHINVCEVLLDRGANVNQAGQHGYTPLCVASMEGHTDICELLLDRGANVNQAAQNGTTPMWHASEWNYYEVCAVLIRHGAQIRDTYLDKLDDSITDALCQRPLVDLRETYVYKVESLEHMVKIMRNVEFIVLDEEPSEDHEQPHSWVILFGKLLQEKVALRKDSIQNIISAQEIARGQLDSKNILKEVMSYLYVKMATILKNVPDGGIEELRAMKRNHSEAFESYKHSIEKRFDDQVRPYRREFKRLITARLQTARDYMGATRPPPAKKSRELHEEMNALRF